MNLLRLETSLQANLMEALTQYGHLEQEMDNNNQMFSQQPPPYPHENFNKSHFAPPPDPQANAIKTQYQTDPAVLRTLDAITAQLASLATTGNRYQRNRTTTPGGDSDNLPSVNPRTGKPYKRYCWTHGCCNHWSRHCKNKKDGHQNEATFKNRMGGSNDNCLPNPPS